MARAYAGGSVLNAIATWKGSAFAISLTVEVRARRGKESPQSVLLEKVYEVFKEKVCDPGEVRFEVKSEVPEGGGLKSSSAVANAATFALFELCGIVPSPYYALKLSVEAAKRAGVTVTGAFDDAAASALGGLVITDNKEMVVEERRPLLGLKAVVLPKGGRKLSYEEIAGRLRLFKREFEKVYELLRLGHTFEAMNLNGALVAGALGYSQEPVMEALRAGALAASVSGNGPSYVALVDPDKAEDVAEAWRRFGKPVIANVVNEPAYLA